MTDSPDSSKWGSSKPDPSKPDREISTEFSQEDFVEIFSKHSRQVYRFILTLTTNRCDADDIFQATSVILFKKFAAFDPSIGSFYSWACRIAYLEVLNLRRSKRRAYIVSDEVLELLHVNMQQRAAELNTREEALEECIKKLPHTERRLIEDRYHRDMATKELASRAGCSVHAIYRLLAKAHGMLHRCIDRSILAENR